TEDPTTHLTAVVMPYLGNATLHDVLDRILAKGGPPPQAREILDAVQAKGRGEIAPTDPVGADTALPVGAYIEGVLPLTAHPPAQPGCPRPWGTPPAGPPFLTLQARPPSSRPGRAGRCSPTSPPPPTASTGVSVSAARSLTWRPNSCVR